MPRAKKQIDEMSPIEALNEALEPTEEEIKAVPVEKVIKKQEETEKLLVKTAGGRLVAVSGGLFKIYNQRGQLLQTGKVEREMRKLFANYTRAYVKSSTGLQLVNIF
jgi:hypothetical protein